MVACMIQHFRSSARKYMFHIDGVVAKMMYRAAYIFLAFWSYCSMVSHLSWSSVHVSSCLRFIHFGTSLKVT